MHYNTIFQYMYNTDKILLYMQQYMFMYWVPFHVGITNMVNSQKMKEILEVKTIFLHVHLTGV